MTGHQTKLSHIRGKPRSENKFPSLKSPLSLFVNITSSRTYPPQTSNGKILHSYYSGGTKIFQKENGKLENGNFGVQQIVPENSGFIEICGVWAFEIPGCSPKILINKSKTRIRPLVLFLFGLFWWSLRIFSYSFVPDQLKENEEIFG